MIEKLERLVMDDFNTDQSPESIRGVLDNLEKEIGPEKMPKVLEPIVPIAAENFMSAAHTQAMTTVERLRARACALRERAGELDAVADRLEKLCPQVLDAIEGLVKYEQEAHRQCNSLQLIRPLGDANLPTGDD